ncbi:MAG: hypothetical protein HZY76_21090 [Anaerolineae bacterium]|nr:MAG: hypothetical protein HZY76_21090 [Anaerolineae bacterium]
MADYLRVALHHPDLLTTDGATRIAAGLAAARQRGDDTLADVLLTRYEHLVGSPRSWPRANTRWSRRSSWPRRGRRGLPTPGFFI